MGRAADAGARGVSGGMLALRWVLLAALGAVLAFGVRYTLGRTAQTEPPPAGTEVTVETAPPDEAEPGVDVTTRAADAVEAAPTPEQRPPPGEAQAASSEAPTETETPGEAEADASDERAAEASDREPARHRSTRRTGRPTMRTEMAPRMTEPGYVEEFPL